MILAVDLGKKTSGLAISGGTLATPLETIVHNSLDEAIFKITKVCKHHDVDKIIVGFVEGEIKSYFEKFASLFQKTNPNIPVILLDETMTTRQSRQTMIKLQVPKTKRAKREHEIAASLLLQSYLDTQ